jgi:hypothetical protein
MVEARIVLDEAKPYHLLFGETTIALAQKLLQDLDAS